MFVFHKIGRALFSWNTRFEIRPFGLSPTNWANIATSGLSFPKLYTYCENFKVFCYFNMIGQGVTNLWTLHTQTSNTRCYLIRIQNFQIKLTFFSPYSISYLKSRATNVIMLENIQCGLITLLIRTNIFNIVHW